MRQLLVTAAIIKKDGAYLLTQRPPDKHNGNRWEFPGGKVDFGEEPRDCLAREIKEELGITITVGELFDVSSHVYQEEKHVILLAFLCNYGSGIIQKHDIQNYAWVSPKEFSSYDITEADRPFIARLLSLHR